MNAILLRHTKTAAPEGLCYGRTEVPLADTFAAEAAAVRAALPPGPWRIVSSPAERCCRLAQFLGGPATYDERLRELNFGEWGTRRWSDLPRAATEHWLADFVHRRPPGGESFSELAARAAAALSDLAREPDTCPLLVITHAGVIRALLARAEGRPLVEAFARPVSFGGIYRLPSALSSLVP